MPRPAQAWSSLGHQTAAVIALEYLSPDATKKVNAILNGETIEKASTWPDAVKSATDWKHAKYYHYKNLPAGSDYLSDLKNLSPSLRARSDVVRALLHAEDVLIDASTTPQDRKNALRFFIHLMADLHQPLHAGFATDSGGNSVSLTWYGTKTNLHALWDRYLLLSYGKKHLPPAEYYDPSDMAQSFSNVSATTLAQWKQGSYVDWFSESIQHRDEAYDNLKTTNDSYYNSHIETVETQIHKAGYRMALLLDSLLGKAPTLPKNNLSLRTTILNIIGVSEVDFNTDLELDAFTSFRFYSSYEDDTHDDCEAH